MPDINYSKAFERLKIDNEYTCERHLNLNWWECKECPYFYAGGSTGRMACCLLHNMKEWVLYHIDISEDKENE